MMPWPYPAPDDDGGAAHLRAGTPLPHIALSSSDGGEVLLATLPGSSVVFIYPWTGRPGVPNPPDWDHIPGAHGSTPQAEGFRNLLPEFTAKGFRVFGLSGSDADWQREFADRMRLGYPLLSDAGFAFAGPLQLPRFETGGTTYLKRLTLVCRSGTIERVIYPVHPPDSHAASLLSELSGERPSVAGR